jgi:hypothetical protein
MTTHIVMLLSKSAQGRYAYAALIAVWAVAVAVGWWQTVRYEFATTGWGESRFARSWPIDSALVPAAGRPTLLVFLHPKCPCTRATLNELDRLVATVAGQHLTRPKLQIVAAVPPEADESWWDTKTVAVGRQLAGDNVYIDRAGREAARFGVSTSGTLLLFDESGNRRFGGGITVSRGHEGDSAGADCLVERIAGRGVGVAEMPVFGCRLCLPEVERQRAPRLPGRSKAINARLDV